MSHSHPKISCAKIGALCLLGTMSIALAGCQSSNDDSANNLPTASSTVPMTAAPGDNMPAAAHGTHATLGISSASFAMQAATGGMLQLSLADLALEKTGNARIRTFAEKIKTDRSADAGKLKLIADQDAVTMPTDMTTDQKAILTALTAKHGTDFDQAWIETMAKLLHIAMGQFDDGSKTASTQDLREFAAATLPNLKAQWNIAQSLQPAARDATQPNPSASTP